MSVPPLRREMPVDYQREDAELVLNALRAGDSCHLVGIGSVGKSNFLRHLLKPEVKRQVLGVHAENLIMVLLDPHNLLHLQGHALERNGSLWAGYELILSRLHRTLWKLDVEGKSSEPTGLLVRLHELRYKIFDRDPVTAQTGLRQLETSIYEIRTAHPERQIVFVFDEIEAFRQLPDVFFQSLRGVRDDNKGGVMYLTTGRGELEPMFYAGKNRAQQHILESFVELFHDQTYYMRPMYRNDVSTVVDEFITRYRYEQFVNARLRERLSLDLFTLSGGHVGLVRRSFKPAVHFLASTMDYSIPDDLRDHLLKDGGVLKECEILMKSLSNEERLVLKFLLADGTIPDDLSDYRQKLIDKYFLTKTGDQIRLPLLSQYCLLHPEALTPSVELPES